VINRNPETGNDIGYELYAGLASPNVVYPDLENSILEPIFYPGSPMSTSLWFCAVNWSCPASTRSSGASTTAPPTSPSATTEGDASLDAGWRPRRGRQALCLPGNSLVGQAKGIARIGYFWASSSSRISPAIRAASRRPAGGGVRPVPCRCRRQSVLAQISVSRWSDGDLDAYLYYKPPSGEGTTYYLAHYSSDYDNATTDCRSTSRSTKTGSAPRWPTASTVSPAVELAGQCMTLDMTQAGARTMVVSRCGPSTTLDSQNNPSW